MMQITAEQEFLLYVAKHIALWATSPYLGEYLDKLLGQMYVEH